MTTFIGVDLAWRSDRNPTAAAVLSGSRAGAEIAAISGPLGGIQSVLAFIRQHSAPETVVAVDAPLIISNSDGQRICESAVGRRYGAREASCHTSNLRLYPNAASVWLAEQLQREGYVHAPFASDSSVRVLAEVYPHAALVALFDLSKTIKYKKGLIGQKRSGLAVFREHLKRLFRAEPRLVANATLDELLSENLAELRGRGLKNHEDRLDAVFCAYLAFFFWYWRLERNEFFGDGTQGYILNPLLITGGIAEAA